MPHSFRLMLGLLLLLLACPTPAAPAEAAGTPYQSGFARWRAAEDGFAGWQRSGVVAGPGGTLQLDLAGATSASDPYPPGGYHGRSFYNGGRFLVGEAVSPVVSTPFGFYEAIASWNATTPPGTWIEILIRAHIGGRWTGWYNLGVWAADEATVVRHSVDRQRDDDGTVAVDTLALAHTQPGARALQLTVRLFSASEAAPLLHQVAVAYTTTPEKPRTLTPGNPGHWKRLLAVPRCSQMVYPDGGEVWCSPTSLAMVLAYWQNSGSACAPQVRAAVAGVFDWRYGGHGNWPFNTAYAATRGLEGSVVRFTSLAQAEAWIAAGVPLVISYAWGRNELTGAPASASRGHLAVLVGFDARGNPIVNDPAAPSDSEVQRTYPRTELEALWLAHSGGTAYLIYPPSWPVPRL